MVIDTSVHFPDLARIRTALDSASRRAVYLDPAALSRELFDDEQYTNMLLVGAAFQTGALPISAHAIERAITLNGAAVEMNLQAFRRGRQAVADPDALRAAIETNRRAGFTPAEPSAQARQVAAIVATESDSELARLVTLRSAELIDYQNVSYAREYVQFVENVRAAEDRAVAGSTRLTETVAKNLYKLMAYKDEYEVARLTLDPAFAATVEETFGKTAKKSVRLHPPTLRAMGMKNKIALGAWATPAFRALKGMRRLRGTRLDVFGYHHIRKLERELIEEYREVVGNLLLDLTQGNLEAAVEIAGLPDMVRGYEQIKVDNVRAYRERLSSLIDAYVRPESATTAV